MDPIPPTPNNNSQSIERALDAIARAILSKFAAAPGTAALVTTQETTTSTSYVDLTTTSATVTINVGAYGQVLLNLYCGRYNNTATGQALMSFAASGANTIAASDAYCIGEVNPANYQYNGGATHLLTGLSPGSTTFKAKYRAHTAGTANFLNRRISAIPL